jgi:membrane protein implicated in regulation of membrane protease activity
MTTPAANPTPAPTTSRWTFGRVAALAAMLMILPVVALFVTALVLAMVNAEGSAAFFSYLRDILIVAMCLQGVLVVVALAVLIVQVARFVNLLRSEARPLAEHARETLKTVRSTTQFVSEQAVEPIVSAKSWLTGIKTFFALMTNTRALVALFRSRKDRPS